jgi:hypothetical protein
VNATNDNAALEESWFFYDLQGAGGVIKGDLTQVERWLDRWTGTPTSCTGASKSCARAWSTTDSAT